MTHALEDAIGDILKTEPPPPPPPVPSTPPSSLPPVPPPPETSSKGMFLLSFYQGNERNSYDSLSLEDVLFYAGPPQISG